MIDGKFKIFVLNPGSTSTKIGMYLNDKEVFKMTVEHKPENLGPLQEQLLYRKECILEEVSKRGYDLKNTDVFVGRGGSMQPCVGGIYHVNEKMLEDARFGPFGVHPARLSCQLIDMLSSEYGGKACVVDPPDTDEFMEVSRLTGIRGVYNRSSAHALNQKSIARSYAKSIGKKYEELNLIVAHLGGGMSITAHEKGKMIDSNNILYGSGPIAPTRCGDIAPGILIDLCFSGKYTHKELTSLTHKNGGLMDLLGTADIREACERMDAGDSYAKLCLDTMIYSIAKCIGARAISLKGKVDQILITGGVAHSKYLISQVEEWSEWIAPITVIPGELEIEALAAGGLRWLSGEEESLEYTGKPVWKPEPQTADEL